MKSIEKQALRAKLQFIRNTSDARYRREACLKLLDIFLKFSQQHPIFPTDYCMGGFYPIRSEINILPILAHVESLGHLIALPVIFKNQQKLDFVRWSVNACTRLHPKFGFPEPVDYSSLLLPDVFLIPLLGFDRQGYRVGYGRGYYDRTLSEPQYKNALTLGCAFSIQELQRVPRESSDMALDFILTEKEIIDCSKKTSS